MNQNRHDNVQSHRFLTKDPTSTLGEDRIARILKNDCSGHGNGTNHPTSFLETLMHLFRGNVGPGMFAMGDAFKNSGVVLGSFLLPLLGLICVHSQHLLLNASLHLQDKLNLKRNPGFATTVELCFATGHLRLQKYATVSRRLVNLFLCLTQLGFCCVYFVFISRNLKQIIDSYGYEYSIHLHMAGVLIPIYLTCMVRNLKFLAPLSTLANILMVSGVIITLYYAARPPSAFNVVNFARIGQLPLAFGTAVYAYEGIGLVLPLQNAMKMPHKFDSTFGVLNVGMVIVTVFFFAVGLLSYLKYGDDIHGSVTLNLPKNEVLAQCVKMIISTGVLLTFALQFYIPIDLMLPTVREHFRQRPVLVELVFRTVFVLITFTLAELIPFLDLFITLVGAFSSTTIALIVPPILELITRRITPWILLKDAFIVVVGLLGCVTGSFESIQLIVNAFKE
ncbi:proton-coupled amino acid transporter 4-like isoform X1 [Photinus pyralis]|uniref:proton-coupled amino acid transporter 4-like isoform X1 n=1 Tax=Photinus pyralis TaxID=7054 RepID=UPI0012674722|nr:proton-coupled amino acid transporter 4-like isoform X1 [Photinus pyralis]XP_031356161.1 proton-coupled amino acid transporter 4-like isoform X1 [Photinus pyralis]XP_031356162.1 proton-coupled amino acid transporter 4-like isoform X1 [Photinus pyralis]